MKKEFVLFLITLCITQISGFAQTMNTISYRNLDIPFIETDAFQYNFDYPICADILYSDEYYPPENGLYFKSTYGHRYLSYSAKKTDNHGGFDYWSETICDDVAYNDSNKVWINCMCDGIISEVVNGTDSLMETIAGGRSVQVRCDSFSQVFDTNILINYRHLSSLGSKALIADSASQNNIPISKGDTIGIIGESGYTSSVHLHISTQAVHPEYGNTFVNPARLFSPFLHQNVLAPLTKAEIELLHHWPDSALFRITWPYNQTINRFQFINESFNVAFNKEHAYSTGSSLRDNIDCVPGIKIFAYQFNGKRTAKYRYDLEKDNMPAFYPASPQRDTNVAMYNYSHIPITYDSVAYVYDFIVEDLPEGYNKNKFVVQLSDVWGYTVEGSIDAAFINQNQYKSQTTIFPNPAS